MGATSLLLHEGIVQAIKEHAQRSAIRHENGETTSYYQLGQMALAFTDILNLCHGPLLSSAPLVGILSAVHQYSIAGVLGILLRGSAYVPLDEQSSCARLSSIVENCTLEVLLVESILVERFAPLLTLAPIKTIIVFGDDPYPQELLASKKVICFSAFYAESSPRAFPPQSKQVPNDLAYVLHSSGSTGIPKGIMLSHLNAWTFVQWMQAEFKLTSADRVMARAPLKFDLSVFDIFNTLGVGATLICFDWHRTRNREARHRDYVALLERERASLLYTTPSTLIALRNHGGLGHRPSALRTIMYAGEPFPLPQLADLMKDLAGVRIANIYGPTETNIISCFWVENLKREWGSIPLGRVVEGSEILVVSDDQTRICAADEVGEIWCRGNTVTLGYWGDHKQTARCLVLSPFHAYPAYFWRTGDYGFRDSQNLLHYRGRRDHMVKIKGYRVELGEIEARLASIEGIDEFCVLALSREEQEKILLCCYATKNQSEIADELFIDSLRIYLPAYMLPQRFVFYKELPKTSSGKIDRLRLATEVNV